MKDFITAVGLDVHKQTIVASVLPAGADRPLVAVTFENHPNALEKFVSRLAPKYQMEFVYEAGPCGYDVYRQLTEMGQPCTVIAPGLTPVRPGDRVKTDRRDAEKLARLFRAGELTAIRVPTREEEAARDLVRVREDILTDRLRARHRLSKFLLRQGCVYPEKTAWTLDHHAWLRKQRFEWAALQHTYEAYIRGVEEADARIRSADQLIEEMAQKDPYRLPVQYLRCLKGIETLSAMTLAVEAQEFRRFGDARAFMSYTGLVGSENSSGGTIRRGGITKAGNAHIRRVLVEAAINYRHRSVMSKKLAARRRDCPWEVIKIAQKAQDRLQRKFSRMISRNKPYQVVVVSVARELAGFIWAVAQTFPSATPA